jgi:hypothetical protein
MNANRIVWVATPFLSLDTKPGLWRRGSKISVTIWTAVAKYRLRKLGMQSGEAACTSPGPDIEQLMSRYQQADSAAALVESLSPQLYRFFAGQMGGAADAGDMLQDVWLRIHRVCHTYRPGDPLLPWVYAITRRVRADSYRKRQRITSRERTVDALPEPSARKTEETKNLPPSKTLSPRCRRVSARC